MSVVMTLLLCLCLTLLNVEILKLWGDDLGDTSHEEICFVMTFIVMAISSFYTGKSLISVLIKVRWKCTDKLPERDEGHISVAFFTKEKCLLNGMYYFAQKQFVSYDGISFRKSEVLSWCYDYGSDFFIKYFEYPERTGF